MPRSAAGTAARGRSSLRPPASALGLTAVHWRRCTARAHAWRAAHSWLTRDRDAALARKRRHRHARRVSHQADLVVVEIAARVLGPRVAGDLLRTHARVAAADVEVNARRAAAADRPR